ncbi:hypothetical protein [Micromonospora inaquosa]|uniref:hypothetical protein n=1 Tax=Micromonospora inaquosa TaxID=2203716 RepID=UPI003CC58F6B
MSDTTIRPFRVEIPQTALDDLAGRLGNTNWPADLPAAGDSYGMAPAGCAPSSTGGGASSTGAPSRPT